MLSSGGNDIQALSIACPMFCEGVCSQPGYDGSSVWSWQPEYLTLKLGFCCLAQLTSPELALICLNNAWISSDLCPMHDVHGKADCTINGGLATNGAKLEEALVIAEASGRLFPRDSNQGRREIGDTLSGDGLHRPIPATLKRRQNNPKTASDFQPENVERLAQLYQPVMTGQTPD